MTGAYPMAVELSVVPPDGGLLDELVRDGALEGEVAFGPTRESEVDGQLYLDLGAVTEVVKSVTAVLGGLAGAAKIVELVAERAKRSKKRILVTIGSTTVTVTGGNDPERTRAALRAALKLV